MNVSSSIYNFLQSSAFSPSNVMSPVDLEFKFSLTQQTIYVVTTERDAVSENFEK
jgi:hypothetical protein